MSDESSSPTRLGRSQKLQLSSRGREAVQAYASMIELARSGTGRAEFDAARKAWGAPRGLAANDGLFLMEFEAGARTLQEAARALEASGTPAKEVKTAVLHLIELGMLETVAPPEPPPAPAYRSRW